MKPNESTNDAGAWRAISIDEVRSEIRKGIARMDEELLALWHAIQIPPERWRQEPHGVEGGGFWAVAVLGKHVIWFNDIEDGFNCPHYTEHGTIDEYVCDQ